MQRKLSLILALAIILSVLTGCAPKPTQSEIEKIIAEAETLSFEDLCKKAITESNGKTMYGIGNSSRGATAATGFIDILKSIDPSYSGTIEWSQPKSNSIFTLINADVNSSSHTYAMTLIQDGNQIQSKMLDTGNLLNYIPKEWRAESGTDETANGHPLTLQTLSKVFMFNNIGAATFTNCWDFVDKDVNTMFMGIDSEPVGCNFLYMLTNEKYADYLKDAFDKLPADKQAYFQQTIDSVSNEAAPLGLTAKNAMYSLAWIKLWCQQYNQQTDDGPICNQLVTDTAVNQSGLLVYSKLRAVEESASASKNNITIAAYQDNYAGIGGFAYKHYLQVVKTSPLPWTACAFIAYMTTDKEGFSAWGKDIGGYSANPVCNKDHSQDGYVDGELKFPALNDKGYEWWLSADGGKLVVEDPVYCAQVSITLRDWIDIIVNQ